MMGLPTQGAVEPVKISTPAPSCGASIYSPVSDRPGSARLLTVFAPRVVVTDKLRSYGAAFRELHLTCCRNQGLRKSRKACTRSSISLHCLDTCDLLMPDSSIACTRASTRRVDTPPIQASWITAISAFSELLRASKNGGK